jgi:hypothetical protein
VKLMAPVAAATLLLAMLPLAASGVDLPSLTAVQQSQAPAGFKRCGDPNLVLVFLNPDLRPAEDGYIHASGTFFIQFQARGESALKIEKFTFSFGELLPDGTDLCDTPEWVTGAVYIKDYRCDPDPADGFFVPIDTYNVPDGAYGAAVSAYDGNGQELVRYYAKAKVDNGRNEVTWAQETATVLAGGQRPFYPDRIMAWPMILPGDGQLTGIEQEAAQAGGGAAGLYIEVAEDVSGIEAFINGARLELKDVTPPDRDDDLVPCTAAGEGQVTNHAWGRAWTWDGLVTEQDVVKVRITDLSGNVAEKVVHVGDPTIGGRVVGTETDVNVEFDEPQKESDDNATAVYNVTYTTAKNAGAHADLFVRTKDGKALPEGLVARLRPNHIQMGADETLKGTMTLTGTNASLGTYDLSLVVDFLSGEVRIQKTKDFKFILNARGGTVNDTLASKSGTVQEQTRGQDLNQTAAPPPPPPETKKSPGVEGVVALLAVSAVAVAARRRR